jgi:hypothetical protein
MRLTSVSAIRYCLLNPLPGHVMIGTPGLPRRQRPLVDSAEVVFGFNRLVYMNDRQHSSLPRSWMVRARKPF